MASLDGRNYRPRIFSVYGMCTYYYLHSNLVNLANRGMVLLSDRMIC